MTDAWIIDACRTPRGIGKPGKGALAGIHPQHLAATVLRAIAERNHLDTADVDDIVWGTSAQQGSQAGDLGRMAALTAGYDVRASGVTLDRFCGSGITATAFGAASVMAGLEDVVITGGTEMMSSYGERRGSGESSGPALLGSGNLALQERWPQPHQGVAADTIASIERIPRTALDEFSAESQARAATAIKEGRFDRSVVPVHKEDGSLALDHEQYPRPGTTAEKLATLPASFAAVLDFPLNEDGLTFRGMVASRFPDVEIEPVHHAGSSSGVVDGAAALLLANPDYAKAHGWTPRARVVTSVNVGDDPTLMLNAPVPAARKALARAGLSVADIDVFEVNEAFAVVTEKFIRDLDVDRSKININGGSIALGHPIGATGAVLIGTALDELERTGGRYALITMCAAGGMAPAIIIERI
jgi:acetyl-CoA C-acetyltransferase